MFCNLSTLLVVSWWLLLFMLFRSCFSVSSCVLRTQSSTKKRATLDQKLCPLRIPIALAWHNPEWRCHCQKRRRRRRDGSSVFDGRRKRFLRGGFDRVPPGSCTHEKGHCCLWKIRDDRSDPDGQTRVNSAVVVAQKLSWYLMSTVLYNMSCKAIISFKSS